MKTLNLLAVAGLLSLLFLLGQAGSVQAEAPFQLYIPIAMPPTQVAETPPDTTIVHVAPSGSTAAACGTAASPCRSLQLGVTNAKAAPTDNVIVKVAQGTYTGAGWAVVDLTFGPGEPARNISVVGGYSLSNWNTPSTDRTLTIIDGQNARRGIHVGSVPEVHVSFQGLTVQNSLGATPSVPGGGNFGGGLLCKSDHPALPTFVTVSLTNVLFRNNLTVGTNNHGTGGAGAAFLFRCHANLSNVVFDSNTAQGGNATDNTRGVQALGGGLLVSSGIDPIHQPTVVADNLTLINNRALAGSGGVGTDAIGWRADALGGGASLQMSRIIFSNVTALNNVAVAGTGSSLGGFGAGAGLFFEYATGEIRGGRFEGNIVTGGASAGGDPGVGGGGAIMGTNSVLTLDRLAMVNNTSIGGAGARAGHAGGGALYFTTGNPASTRMRVTGSNLVIANNRSEAGVGINRWGGGGAVFSQDTDLILNHVTIAHNSVLPTMMAPALIVLNNHGSSTTTISNSIVAHHAAASTRDALVAQRRGDVINLNSTLFYQNAVDVGSQYPDATISNVNPVASGDPRFMNPSAPHFDYHIGPNSAARGRASGNLTPIDMDNVNRVARDVGADEYNN